MLFRSRVLGRASWSAAVAVTGARAASTSTAATAGIASAIAPSGTLRAGINLSNFLLVTFRGPNNEPIGVAPDMALALATDLGLPLEMVPYENPGLLSDAATLDEWDIGLIGAEPQRAELISFSQPYCEIEATFLVPFGSTIRSVSEVDAPGVTVGVSQRAAYALWLEANLEHASLFQTAQPGLDLSYTMFIEKQLDVLAGLRPWLLTQADQLPGATVLDGAFTSVQQSIGVPRARADGGVSLFLERWLGEAKESGLVAELIAKHGVKGKLSVAGT